VTGLLGEVDLPAPIGDRWWQDYVPGSVVEFGYVSLSEAEIVAFAQAYDRQQIHTDPVWSVTGPFHGVIASGVQTIAVCMGLYVDHYISRVASLASPGLDEIRWPAPVRPGDRLRIRVTVAQTRLSRSKPDRGLVHSQVAAPNQDDHVVLSFGCGLSPAASGFAVEGDGAVGTEPLGATAKGKGRGYPATDGSTATRSAFVDVLRTRATVERVLVAHPAGCPVARSLRGAVEITTELE